MGFITAETFKRHLPTPYADHKYFICGPEVMMNAIEDVLDELNVPMLNYYSVISVQRLAGWLSAEEFNDD